MAKDFAYRIGIGWWSL